MNIFFTENLFSVRQNYFRHPPHPVPRKELMPPAKTRKLKFQTQDFIPEETLASVCTHINNINAYYHDVYLRCSSLLNHLYASLKLKPSLLTLEGDGSDFVGENVKQLFSLLNPENQGNYETFTHFDNKIREQKQVIEKLQEQLLFQKNMATKQMFTDLVNYQAVDALKQQLSDAKLKLEYYQLQLLLNSPSIPFSLNSILELTKMHKDVLMQLYGVFHFLQNLLSNLGQIDDVEQICFSDMSPQSFEELKKHLNHILKKLLELLDNCYSKDKDKLFKRALLAVREFSESPATDTDRDADLKELLKDTAQQLKNTMTTNSTSQEFSPMEVDFGDDKYSIITPQEPHKSRIINFIRQQHDMNLDPISMLQVASCNLLCVLRKMRKKMEEREQDEPTQQNIIRHLEARRSILLEVH